MGLLMAGVGNSDADAGMIGDYEVEATAVYTNPKPGRSIFNAWTVGYWCGEDSTAAWLDWINPLELAAMGADAGRWIDRQMQKEFIGVTLTLSTKDGSPLRSYSFGVNGGLQSVGIWKDERIVNNYFGDHYLRILEDGTLTDDLLNSLLPE